MRFVLNSGIFSFLAAAVLILTPQPAPAQTRLSNSELQRVGKRIWENECDGSISGLTSWNSGEDFASLGIGHFIWYPAGVEGPFEESFPHLIAYLRQGGVEVPAWLLQTRDCPWANKQAFERDANSERMRSLRDLLSKTVPQQTQFIIARLDAAAPKFQQAAGRNAARVQANMQSLRQTAAGNFAMIDYVNFKGEGLKAEERYNGQGWGLLQVLEQMEPSSPQAAPAAFGKAAGEVLTRRVKDSPPARNEKQWLPGWLNRCRAYGN